MTQPGTGPVDARLVAKLVDACGDGALAVWAEALRDRAADLAAATGGSPVAIEVAITGRRPFRVGILSDGQLHVPLGSTGPCTFRLCGDAEQVARFVLGEGTLVDAQYGGVVVFGSPRPATARLISRLRRVVAAELGAILRLPAVVAIATRRFADRWRQGGMSLPQTAYVTDRAVAVMLAVCGAVAGAPAAVASTHVVAATVAATRTVPADPALSPSQATVVPAPTTVTPTARPDARHQPSSAATATERREIVTTTPSSPYAGNENWTVLTVDCGHRIGEVLCVVLRELPPVEQPPATAAPGQADRR